tara:strand:+ start:551 stop:793 length:243 start_codon:yes stop_codon:yes gene_type:complete
MDSRFTTYINVTDEEVWIKIFELLTSESQIEIDRSNKEVVINDLGEREFLIKGFGGIEIASAMVAENEDNILYWSIYKEV